MIENLSNEEVDLIRRCLDAAVNGPFFPDWEFHSLIGVTRDEVRQVLRSWPKTEDPTFQRTVVVNALNNLLGYPHGMSDAWVQWVRSPRERVSRLMQKVL